jgi:hypothetical protein
MLTQLFIKRSLFLILLIGFLTPNSSFAQFGYKKQKKVVGSNMPKYDRRRFHFGINIGTQLTGVAVRTIPDLRALQPDTVYSITPVWNPGFTMGIETNMRITDNLDLRFTPQLTLTSRTLLFERPAGRIDKFEVEATMVEFPLHIKFKTNRINNFRAYVLGGAKYVYDISNKIQAENASDYPVKFRAHDVQAEMGFGMDFYLPYFKLSTQVKGSWGFVNLNYPENNVYNRGIEGLYARGIFLTVLFE